MMNKEYTFPKGFLWGGATSGPQSEGAFDKPHESVMDYWYHENPEDFFDGVSCEVASDFYHHYKEDFKMMKAYGFNSYRTSIQWSRLIADFEEGTPDPKAIAFYKDVIQTAKDEGIEIILNLHHFDMPIELLKKYGGWESKHVVDLYVKFAKVVFENFGQDCMYFTTFNEPMVIPEAGYLYAFHYPKYKGKGKEAVQIMYNINLASAKAIALYKSMHLPGKIGNILNLTPAYPRSQSKADLEASEFVDNFFNKAFLDPAVKGEFPPKLVEVLKKDNVLFEATAEELEIIANNTVDFLGVNYYHPKRVKARESEYPYDTWMPDLYFEEYFWEECRINLYRGWEIYPQAIYDIAKTVQNEYGNIPWYISENGMGVEGEERYIASDGQIKDDYRIDFYKEHLAWLSKAIDEGSNCFGYHAWAAMDCWSWNNAYKNRYGFFAVDLKTMKRTPKKSAEFLKELSERNGFEYDLKN